MTTNERIALAESLSAAAPKDNQPGQKFPRGARVKVDDEMPAWMSHFASGFVAIVLYTYAQQYDGDDVKKYSLIMLNDAGEPVNCISWYHESQLTLISDDVTPGLKIIAAYYDK